MTTEYDWRMLMEKLDLFEKRLKNLEDKVYDYTPVAYNTNISVSMDNKKILGEVLNQKCLFEGLYKNTPMALSCPCPRCSAWC